MKNNYPLKHKHINAKQPEPTLGKRHEYGENRAPSFKSKAIALGFSDRELKALNKIYDGRADPDS